jgi:hypothetical protein
LKAAVNEFRSEAVDDVGGDRSFRHFSEFETNGVLVVDAIRGILVGIRGARKSG